MVVEGPSPRAHHGTPGDKAIPQVRPSEPPALVEVGSQESHGEFPAERQRVKESTTDDPPVSEVPDGDLEPDARREEDPHEPLQNSLELRRKSNPHVLLPAECQSGKERPHKIGRTRVVRRRHHREEEEEHQRHPRRAVIIPFEPVEVKPIEDGGQDEDRDPAPDEEESQRARDGHDDRRDARVSHQRLSLIHI